MMITFEYIVTLRVRRCGTRVSRVATRRLSPAARLIRYTCHKCLSLAALQMGNKTAIVCFN